MLGMQARHVESRVMMTKSIQRTSSRHTEQVAAPEAGLASQWVATQNFNGSGLLLHTARTTIRP